MFPNKIRVDYFCSSCDADATKAEDRIDRAIEKIEKGFSRLRLEDLKLIRQGLRQLHQVSDFPDRSLVIGNLIIGDLIKPFPKQKVMPG